MIKSLAELGSLYTSHASDEEVDKYLIKYKSKKQTQYLVSINISIQNQVFAYEGVNLEKEVDNSTYKDTLYSNGSSNGPNKTPTAELTEPEKTVNKKIIAFFKNADTPLASQIYELLNTNREIIIHEISAKRQQYEKASLILSLKINNKFLSEITEIDFRKLLLSKQEEKSGKVYSDRCCSICHANKEVLEQGNPFPFFTVDKPGYAYGLNQSNSYKMLPICKTCSDNLYLAKKELNNFSYPFYGNKYLLIPKFVLATELNRKKIMELIKDISNVNLDYTKKEEKQADLFEKVFRKISEKENIVSFYIIFYDAPKGLNGSVFTIFKTIEDIFPSHFKQLYKDIDSTNQMLSSISPEKSNETFSFLTLKYFFIEKFSNSRDNKMFIQATYDIFNKTTLSYDFILNKVMSKVNNPQENMPISAFRGLSLIYFLRRRNMIEYSKGDKMVSLKTDFGENDIVRKIIDFVDSDQNKDFYNSNEKIAVFSLGIIVQKLLTAQMMNLNGNAPFRNQLKGMKLRKEDLLGLFTKASDKLREYDDSGIERFRSLKGFVGEMLSGTSDISKWKLTNDEFNFYLALGMSLALKFKSEKNIDKEAE